jgi:hypothetical protein
LQGMATTLATPAKTRRQVYLCRLFKSLRQSIAHTTVMILKIWHRLCSVLFALWHWFCQAKANCNKKVRAFSKCISLRIGVPQGSVFALNLFLGLSSILRLLHYTLR